MPPPDRQAVAEMAAVLSRMSADVERARRKRAGASALTVLAAVAHAGRARPSELATHLGLSRAAVTRQVQDLLAGGAVATTTDPDDRRSTFVTLTGSGREQLAALGERGVSRFALFTASWDTAEVRELERLLSKLEASIAHAVRHEPPIAERPWQRTLAEAVDGRPHHTEPGAPGGPEDA